MDKALNNKIQTSIKWASITEVMSKLIQPITTMILVRILSPEAFGVVTTVTMIVSFTDMFTDAGFQKYIIQHEFKDEEEKEISINVAFWSNLIISVILWALLAIFSEKIAKLVGNEGLGHVIAIAGLSIPLTSFSSIQLAIYRRDFVYKQLFLIKTVGILIPFVITIPLAITGYNYWSLIIGTLCGNLYNAVALTIKSTWKPKFKYDFYYLKKMTSFSIWTLVESISIWFGTWMDTFIVGSMLSTYYIGIYKTSMNTVDALFSIFSSTTVPVLFSSLSRVQNNENEFKRIYFSIQRNVSYIIIPLSVGIFIFSDVVVKIFLGDNWSEAIYVVGILGLLQGVKIIVGNYASEVFRAKGMPKLSIKVQMINLAVLVTSCLFAVKYGFIALVNARTIVRIILILVQLFYMQTVINISSIAIFKNINKPIIASIIMGVIGSTLSNINQGMIWKFTSILICIIVYFIVIMSFKSSRREILNIINKFIKNRVSKNNILID